MTSREFRAWPTSSRPNDLHLSSLFPLRTMIKETVQGAKIICWIFCVNLHSDSPPSLLFSRRAIWIQKPEKNAWQSNCRMLPCTPALWGLSNFGFSLANRENLPLAIVAQNYPAAANLGRESIPLFSLTVWVFQMKFPFGYFCVSAFPSDSCRMV